MGEVNLDELAILRNVETRYNVLMHASMYIQFSIAALTDTPILPEYLEKYFNNSYCNIGGLVFGRYI